MTQITLYEVNSNAELKAAKKIILDYRQHKGSYYSEENGTVYIMDGIPFLAWQDMNLNIYIKQMPYKLGKDI